MADAHLYVWTTNAFMVEAHELARAWEFKPKTILTWVKIKDDGTPSMKTGTWFRGATEHVIFAVRGHCPAGNHSTSTALMTLRTPHSEKPAAFYDIVESMSPGPYLDVFARKLRFNWDAWGNEVYNVPGLPQVGMPLEAPQRPVEPRLGGWELQAESVGGCPPCKYPEDCACDAATGGAR